MTLHPTSIEELAEGLRNAAATGRQITGWELSSLPRSIVHRDDDLTVTLTSNIHLSELQLELAAYRQWLPIDPPATTSPTIEQIISHNLSGPRRYGYGIIREHILGVTVMLADGRVVHSGGQVVKNVAGFDLCRLFVGNRGSLGIILEATFKLRPLPETKGLFACQCSTLPEADEAITQLINSPLTPVLLDLHNLNKNGGWGVVVGFEGATEDVAWQTDILQTIGEFNACDDGYLKTAIQQIPKINATYSVLPSRICEVIKSLPEQPTLAHAGNGIIRNGTMDIGTSNSSASDVLKRLKNEFDPAGILAGEYLRGTSTC